MPPTVRSFSARARPPLTAPTATRRTSCSSRSFDPDPQPVAEELWPGAVVEHSVGGLAEAGEGVGDLLVSREVRRATPALRPSHWPVGRGFPADPPRAARGRSESGGWPESRRDAGPSASSPPPPASTVAAAARDAPS